MVGGMVRCGLGFLVNCGLERFLFEAEQGAGARRPEDCRTHETDADRFVPPWYDPFFKDIRRWRVDHGQKVGTRLFQV